MIVSELIEKIKDYPDYPIRNYGEGGIAVKKNDSENVALDCCGETVTAQELIDIIKVNPDAYVWVAGYNSYVDSSLEYWGSVRDDYIELTLGL